MHFSQPLLSARFIRRYKRFLVDVRLPDGVQLTGHCPNTGSMRGCLPSDAEVLLSVSANTKRKYAHTLEMVRVGKTWVGVNTSLTNKLVREALENRVFADLGRIDDIRSEVKVSPESRLDFVFRAQGREWFAEVKNCTLVEDDAAMFPDAVSARATRHLLELEKLAGQGHGAAVIFCVQREDGVYFSPARHIDPVYGETLRRVSQNGVRVYACQARLRPDYIKVVRLLPVKV